MTWDCLLPNLESSGQTRMSRSSYLQDTTRNSLTERVTFFFPSILVFFKYCLAWELFSQLEPHKPLPFQCRPLTGHFSVDQCWEVGLGCRGEQQCRGDSAEPLLPGREVAGGRWVVRAWNIQKPAPEAKGGRTHRASSASQESPS